MDKRHTNFVRAVQVAAELEKARFIAREITLTASNARALSLRAGTGAAGFRALTDYIHRLADSTVCASDLINRNAIEISRLAMDYFRLSFSIARYKEAQDKIGGEGFAASLVEPLADLTARHEKLRKHFLQAVDKLQEDVDELSRELKSAAILSSMSRVEAAQSGEFEESLNVVAESVSGAARRITGHIGRSQRLCISMLETG